MKQIQKDSAIDAIRHSLAHLLAMAVLKKFPKAKLGIGPTIEHGFYYDFKLPKPVSDADLKEFEQTMRDLIAQKLDFTGRKLIKHYGCYACHNIAGFENDGDTNTCSSTSSSVTRCLCYAP